ncbi:MAG TPA: hypothetical protein VFB72_08075 [Verrucomicrobiae bacterium]|nr:hypothetical protein [Verrucomicrobiae bacterium]
MKLTSKNLYLTLAAIALTLTFGLNSAYAESPRDELIHAYQLLQRSNGDYAGHKAKAMEEIQAAGRSMNLNFEGLRMSTEERQWKSDEQLTEARRLLNDASQKLESRDREHAAEHLQRAIRDLDEALSHR